MQLLKIGLTLAFVVQLVVALPVCSTAQDERNVVIPFRLTQWNNISIPVILNDRVALNLMFHTAVDGVSLTKATTERFPEISLDQEADVESWGGRSKSRFGTGHSLKIGELHLSSMTVFEDLHSGHGTDGKFGPGQLECNRLLIDFDRSEIHLLSELPSDLSDWQKQSFEIDRGMIFITASMMEGDSQATHKFMIHSGYSGFALLDDEFVASHPFLKDLDVVSESELTDSAGNKLKTTQAILSKISIGEYEFQDAPVTFFSGAIGRQKFSVLGGDVLKRFNLVFDFDNQTLYMKKNSLAEDKFFRKD